MDRKTLLAIVVVGLIIVLTPYYYQLVSPTPEPGTADTAMVQQAPADSGQTVANANATGEPEQTTPAKKATPEPVATTAPGTERPWFSPDPEEQAEQVTVETPLYRAVLSTHGATVRSWVIKPTQPYLSEPEQLVRAKYGDRNLVLTARGGLGLLRTESKNFQVDTTGISLDSTSAPQTLTFTLPLPNGGYYREIYTFFPDRYDFDLKLESKGLSELTGAATAWFGWDGGLASTEEDTSQDLFYTEAYYQMGNSTEKFKSKGTKADEEEATGPTDWVAQRTKYFLFALLPQKPAEGARLATWPDSSYQGKYNPKLFATEVSLSLVEQGDLNNKMRVYLGPLDYSSIRAVDPSLEETMSWGWKIIEPFSKGVFWALVWSHKFIPNYGVILLLFAVAVKVIVWPLTHKSQQSMKRMQLLQPMLKELQTKYKDNPQKMQQEVMGLYKKYKVNPMGGCWPVFIQMPLFYALFIIFRSTIELRGQPFVFWITDLSMPDVLFNLPFSIPLYGSHVALLPIIMAVSTYLQSKTTMTDPNQKGMLYFMPIMFIFLFNNFPSGLTLYYTLFNLTSWLQQRMIKVHDPALEQAVEDAEEEREKQIEREERKARKKNRNQ